MNQALLDILDIAFDSDNRLYVLETFDVDSGTPGLSKIVRLDVDGTIETIASGVNFPTAMTFGPDGSLYVSVWGVGLPGNGQIVQVSFKCERIQGEKAE